MTRGALIAGVRNGRCYGRSRPLIGRRARLAAAKVVLCLACVGGMVAVSWSWPMRRAWPWRAGALAGRERHSGSRRRNRCVRVPYIKGRPTLWCAAAASVEVRCRSAPHVVGRPDGRCRPPRTERTPRRVMRRPALLGAVRRGPAGAGGVGRRTSNRRSAFAATHRGDASSARIVAARSRLRRCVCMGHAEVGGWLHIGGMRHVGGLRGGNRGGDDLVRGD